MISTMLFCLADLAKASKINNPTWRICLALAAFLRRAGGSGDLRVASLRQPPPAPEAGMCLLNSY
jgi:hypothetical protein